MRSREWTELGLVTLTAAGHLVFQVLLPWSGPFIVAAVAGWATYIAWRLRTPGQARAWGFRSDNLGAALRDNAAFIAVGVVAILVYALVRGTLAPPPLSFYVTLLLYPVWGCVQQFLICAVVFANLATVTKRTNLAHVLAVVLFGVVHLPDVRLAALTAVACAVWMALYRRTPNLFAQGLSHGILAALAYRFVLEQDPLHDVWVSLGR